MKPELFVDNQLHLMKSSFEFHDKILKEIRSESKELKQKNPVFKKKKISKFLYNDTENIKNNLIYLSYALSTIKNINLRDNQLFTAFKACSSCLFSNSYFKLEKGIVYQLDTGEGKSYIIQIIAALLANYGYFVHIASSNIYLAKRDYSSSFVFFNNLNIKSSVLLHQNELGTSKFYGDEGIEKDLFNSTSFNDENFKNSLTMNFCACGYDNDFKPIQNPPKIVFSTFVNFEAFYLKLIENVMPSNVEKYYDTRALIVDEADSILIDDLTNGTILSRPISSNAKSVLTFVYRCKMGLLTLENLKKIVKFFSLDIKNKSDNDEFIKDLFSHYQNCVLKSKASEQEELLKFLSNCSRNQLKKEFLQKFVQKLWPKNENINEAIQIYNKIEKNKKKSSIIKMNLANFMNLIVFLCQTKIGWLNSNVVLKMIKNFWPNSFELTIDTIKTMYQEIELVQMPEFVDGRKYSIQPIKKNKDENIKSKFFQGLSKLINLYKYVNEKSTGPIVGDNNKNEEEEDEEDDDYLAYGRIFASITEKIDLIFNKICDEINETIGGYTGLKFFLRRTLAGCEFGVCIDFLLYNVDFEKLGPNCLFDKDPLLLFTIQIKNKGAVLAGILIIVLVYVAKICSLIFNQINQVSVIGKKTLYNLIEKLSLKKFSKEINELFLKLNEKLYNILQSQINKYVKYNKDSKFITIISFISNLCYNQTKFSDFSDGLENFLGNNFKMNAKLSNSFHSFFPHLIKLTILIFLCIAVFFYNFKIRKEIDKKVSKKYDIQNEAENFDKNQNLTASYNKNQSNILIINPFE